MIQHQGIFLPDGETHLTEWMTKSGEWVDGKGTYQIKKLRAAVAQCTNHRLAVDIGAHCGLWSMQLAKAFDQVHAFEPVAAHRACFERNVFGWDENRQHNMTDTGAVLHACALGDRDGMVRIETAPTSSGDSRVALGVMDEGADVVPLRKLDDFGLQCVDFVKLDCEGYELFALKGGEQTIRASRPVICVEQKKGHAQHFGLGETEAVEWLGRRGYRVALVLSGDYIMVPE